MDICDLTLCPKFTDKLTGLHSKFCLAQLFNTENISSHLAQEKNFFPKFKSHLKPWDYYAQIVEQISSLR